MINATIPLERVKITLEGQGYVVPTVVHFDRCNVQIGFGETVSFEFALVGGNLRMVTRRFIDGKVNAEVITVASGLRSVPADSPTLSIEE
jgi:hypothetical protein